MKLNRTELKVLKALAESMSGNGYDFGFTDEVDYKALGLSKNQYAGYVSSLVTKDIIWSEDCDTGFKIINGQCGFQENGYAVRAAELVGVDPSHVEAFYISREKGTLPAATDIEVTEDAKSSSKPNLKKEVKTMSKKTTTKKTAATKPLTEKVLTRISKSPAKVAAMAKTFKVEDRKIRGAIDRLRRAGYEVRNDDGAYHV